MGAGPRGQRLGYVHRQLRLPGGVALLRRCLLLQSQDQRLYHIQPHVLPSAGL